MSTAELPRAYARQASSSSSSTSTFSESSDSSSDRRHRRKFSTSSSSSTTPDYNKAARKRALKRRKYRKRRQSSSRGRPELRSSLGRKRRHVTPPVSKSSTTSSSSSSSESDESDRSRRSPSRSKRSSHEPTRQGYANRGERFFYPRPVTGQSTRPTYDCKCGERYGSRKALIHHTIQNHDADVPCFACNQTIASLSQLMEHIKTEHEKALIVCVYCKSVFGKANDMTENQWKRLKTHMYGELVYAKLAEMEDD